MLVPCHWTLPQLQQTIRALFGWSEAHPYRFLIRGKALPGDSESETASRFRCQIFGLPSRAVFLYDYRFELKTPLWRHEIRVEKILPAPRRVPLSPVHRRRWHSAAGAIASPQEFRHMMGLFTPGYILHHLAEMIDRGDPDQQLAAEVRYLRPWLTMGGFRWRTPINQQLTSGLADQGQIQVASSSDDGRVQEVEGERHAYVACLKRGMLTPEELGLNLVITDLLKQVLPVGEELNAVTLHSNLQKVAERMEAEMGEERLNFLDNIPPAKSNDPVPPANALADAGTGWGVCACRRARRLVRGDRGQEHESTG